LEDGLCHGWKKADFNKIASFRLSALKTLPRMVVPSRDKTANKPIDKQGAAQ
jgi:hypothetical protein